MAFMPQERRGAGYYPYLPYGFPDAHRRDGHHVRFPHLPPKHVVTAVDKYLFGALPSAFRELGVDFDRCGDFAANWIWSRRVRSAGQLAIKLGY